MRFLSIIKIENHDESLDHRDSPPGPNALFKMRRYFISGRYNSPSSGAWYNIKEINIVLQDFNAFKSFKSVMNQFHNFTEVKKKKHIR